MAGTPATPQPGLNWRFALCVGLPIGVAVPVSQGVTKWLEPDLGHWAAFAVSLVAAAAAGVLMALAVSRALSRHEASDAKPGAATG